jgi:hypothetical protein
MSILDNKSSLENYQLLLVEVANLVQNHRVIAIQSVQTISNQLYWNIGELIIKKQDEFGWGYSIVKQMSLDLPKLIGEGISWSPRNLWLMRQFVQEYSNMNQADSQKRFNEFNLQEKAKVNQTDSVLENVKKLLFEVPWQHNVLIFQKIKDLEVEYALRSANKPIGVSEYVLSKDLPSEFIGKLPTVEQFNNIF